MDAGKALASLPASIFHHLNFQRERIDDGTWIRRVSSSISPSFPKIVQIRGFHAARGLRTETEFIGFAGRRTQTAPAPGPPSLLHATPWFAYENRFYWLCRQAYANRAGARAAFSASRGPLVRVREPNLLALRAGVRKPCRRPGRLFWKSHLGVRARKPNLLALREVRREPRRHPGRLFWNSRPGPPLVCLADGFHDVFRPHNGNAGQGKLAVLLR